MAYLSFWNLSSTEGGTVLFILAFVPGTFESIGCIFLCKSRRLSKKDICYLYIYNEVK